MDKTITFLTTSTQSVRRGFLLLFFSVLMIGSSFGQYTTPGHYYGCNYLNGSNQYPRYAAIEDITITDGSGNVVFGKTGDGCNNPVQYNSAQGHYNLMSTTSSFTLSAGATYTFSIVTSNPSNSTINSSCGVWFDFNGNQSFGDGGEFVSPVNWVFGVGSTNSFQFTVPCGGTSGSIRMRVRTDYYYYTWNASRHSADRNGGSVYYGETEDYTCSYSVPAGLSSNFFAPDTVYQGTIASFVNSNQSGYISHQWSTSNGVNAGTTNFQNIFNTPGTYSVKLVSENCNGKDSTTKQIVVVAPSAAPIADFVSTKNKVEIFDQFQLIDLSTNGATYWNWYLTNGTDTIDYIMQPALQGNDAYTNRVPVVTTGTNSSSPKAFPDEGLWSVCLQSSNVKGASAVVCKTDYIEVTRTSFSIGPETSLPSNVITATAGTIYDKGGKDGDYTVPESNLEALIAPCGAQSVTLTFNMFRLNSNATLKIYDGVNALGTPLHTGNGFTAGNVPSVITANSGALYMLWNSSAGAVDSGFAATWTSVAGTGAAPVADFELPADTIYNAVTESFINTSQNAEGSTTFEWILNGTTISNNRHLMDQTFLNNNTYTLTLKVTSCDGTVSTVTKTFVVANPNTPTEIDFMADNRRPAVGDEVTFTAYTDKANRWEWSFFPPGGTVPTGVVSDLLPERTFRFTQPGVYAVQLKAYNYNAQPDSSVSEATLVKTSYVIVVEHCLPVISVTTSTDVGISGVSLSDQNGTILNNESDAGDAYTDYSDLGTLELNFGSTYDFTVERATNVNPMNRKIWIDWNVDGDFEDAGELVASEATGNTMSWNGSFTVPDFTQAFEANTRMRVGVSYGNDLNMPCGANSNPAANRIGEFEDYAIRVINDGDEPTITLIDADTLYIEQTTPATYVSPGATAYDPSQGDITANIVMDSDVDQTLTGVYYEVYNASDASGNPASPVTRVVYVVVDQTPPVLTINGASDTTIEVGTPWVDLGATANDAKEGNLDDAIVTSGTVDHTVLGTYMITYYVQDNQGNSSSAIRTIRVVDTQLPVITNAKADDSNDPWIVQVQLQSIFVDITTATDNYNTLGGNLSLTANPASPQGGAAVDTRFQGTTSVTYTAIDESGNTATQVIDYVVRDFIPPVIELNTLPVVYHPVNTPYSPIAASASDNLYDITEISLTEKSNVNPYVLGTYQDTYTATDAAGNISTKVRTVHVIDDVKPEIVAKTSGMLRMGVGSQFNAVDYVLFNDNYDSPADLFANHEIVANDLNVWEAGLYAVTFRTYDNSGNASDDYTLYIDVDYDYYIVTNGVTDLTLDNILNVSPNPTSGLFNVNVNLPENENITLNVFDAMGQQIMNIENGEISNGTYQVDLTNHASGVYYVQMNVQGSIITKKVVLNR